MNTGMPLPKYHQIYLVLREQLREGRFEAGLPGEHALMAEFVKGFAAYAKVAADTVDIKGAGVATAGLMALSIHLLPVLYVLLLGMCLEWVVKNKIDYPSHVFFLFLLTLYFGHRLDLLLAWWPALVLFVAVRWASGSWLRQRYGHRWPVLRWYYASYCEKFVCSGVLAVALGSAGLLLYALGVSATSFWVKKWLPEPET